ncbi:MAG: LysR family transcriptional regulator [Albidovulum sp.]|nr:LysR family transcriptional regulator [Albidovulum sp.]
MKDIQKIKLRLVDGTLLIVFLAVMRHRKATLAANEIGLSQPAVSHALGRLRRLYGDPLFLRSAYGVEPTALARELEPKVRRIVRLISETLEEPSEFDPESSEVTARIAAYDYELATILPQLISGTSRFHRNIRVETLTLSSGEALAGLANSQIDLALGYFETLPFSNSQAQFVYEDLYTEDYVVVGKRGHPLFFGEVTLERYAEALHLLILPSGESKGVVDHALQTHGLYRNVHATVPLFFPALTLLEQSELVATLPRRVAEGHATRFNLDFVALPLPGTSFPVRAVRHVRDANSPFHDWMVALLSSTSK